MLLIDVLVRYPALALLVLLAALTLRAGARNLTTVTVALTCVSMAALLLGTAPEALRLPAPAQALVRIVDTTAIVFIWWLGRAMFEDDFRLGRLEWAGFAAYVGPVLMYRLRELGVQAPAPPWMGVWVDSVSYAIMGQLIWSTLRGRGDDMIEARRNWRFGFVLALAAAIGVSVLSEALAGERNDAIVSTARAAFSLVLTSWALLSLTQFRIEALSFQRETPPASLAIDPRDQALHQKLLAAMEQDRVYAKPGLTIADLAEQLAAPEHRLRALINQGLGFRNFGAFVNSYRLEAAKAALADPELARKQILLIALETGFNSLGPFNRAFKERIGLTPSEYRRAALSPNA